MLVFNNQQRSGYHEVASYGPKYYQEIKEMDTTYQFAGYTLDKMADDLEGIISKQFIDCMDHEAVGRMENFFEIKQNIEKSLAQRKKVLKAVWISSDRLNKSKIIEIVKTFVEATCQVQLVDSNLIISIEFKDNPQLPLKDIRLYIDKGVPAHIGVVYKCLMDLGIIVKSNNLVTVPMMINRMDFYLYPSYFGGKIWNLDGAWALNGSVRLAEDYSPFESKVKNKLEIKHQELISNNLIIKHNDWYLDGAFFIDGTKTMDAWVTEEVL